MSEDQYGEDDYYEDPLERRVVSLEINQTELYHRVEELKEQMFELTRTLRLVSELARSNIEKKGDSK